MLVVLLAAVWLPMTVHCQLESIPGLEFLACASENSSDESKSHCDDSCCSVERTAYKSEQVRQTLPLPDLLPMFSALLLSVSDTLIANLGSEVSTAAPPELSKRWQFIFRTASPLRAPTPAS